MNSRSLLLPALLAVPFVSVRAPELRFAPAEGTTLRYSLDQDMELKLVEASQRFVVDGEEHASDDGDVPDITITEHEHQAYADIYTKAKDGRPQRIERRYEELASTRAQSGSTPDGEDIDEKEDRSSDLEGADVVFAWDEDASEWKKSFGEASADRDEDLLEGIEAEVFFAELLPKDDVAVGATWEIDPRTFLEATSPGGQIPWDDDTPDDDTNDKMLEAVEGSVTAELVGFADEGGTRLATIRFRAELSSEFDDSPSAEELEEVEFDITVEQTLKIELELEGELVWDVKAGHARSSNLEGSVVLTVHGRQEVSGEMSFEIETHQSFEGELKVRVAIE